MKTAVVQAWAVEHLLGNSELLKLLLQWTGIPSSGPLHYSAQGCQEESPAGTKESEILSILTHSLIKNGGATKLTCGLGPLSGVGRVTHPLCYNQFPWQSMYQGQNIQTPSIEVAPLTVSHCVRPQWPVSIDVCHQHFSCASLQSAGVVLIEINDSLGQLSKTRESLGSPPPSIWTSLKANEICPSTMHAPTVLAASPCCSEFLRSRCSRCACTSKRGMNSLDYDAQRVGLNIRSLRRLGSPSEDAEPVPS